MKKLIPWLIILIITLSGCGTRMPNYRKKAADSTTWIKKTIADMISAIESEDKESFVKLFSKNTRSEAEAFSEDVDAFYDFIQGKVESYSLSPGGSASKEVEYGKVIREVYATFCLVTTENTYYIALKECIIDSWNSENEGVISLYIINKKDWQTEFEYHGDGLWTEGINIQVNSRK